MIKVAKLVLINENDEYLLLRRDDHPTYGDDPDLLGGMIDEDETLTEALIREADEEAGVQITEADIRQIYEGTSYSPQRDLYTLYIARLKHTPDITISQEHAGYEWLDRDSFLVKVKEANDPYMHMVYDIMK